MLWNNRNNYQYQSIGITDKGKVRDHNEDAFLDLNQQAIWIVADGAGGHDSGEVASQMIVENLSKLHYQPALNKAADDVCNCLSDVNTELIRLTGGEETQQLIASTVCILIIRKKQCLCLWAGDSRIYLHRNRKLSMLTHDHNRIDEFIAAGFSEEEVAKHPMAQQLVNAVGVKEPLRLERQLYEIKEDDLFLLCSDGLDKELTEQEIEKMLGKKQINEEVRGLIDVTLERGARDNVTAMLVQVTSQ